jgi:hypothetical protein
MVMPTNIEFWGPARVLAGPNKPVPLGAQSGERSTRGSGKGLSCAQSNGIPVEQWVEDQCFAVSIQSRMSAIDRAFQPSISRQITV